jgi:hypothetical protein
VCTAVRLVVCAPTHERRLALRRACAGVAWEVVAAVGGVEDALARVAALRAQVLIVDHDVAPPEDLGARLRRTEERASLVGVGAVAGAAATVPSDDLGRLPATLASVLHARGDHRH